VATIATAAPVAFKVVETKAALADIAGPARAQGEADLAIIKMVREMKANRARADAIDKMCDQARLDGASVQERVRLNRESDVYLERAFQLEDAILELPAGTLAGVLAKFHAWYGDDELEVIRENRQEHLDSLPAESHTSIFLDLERLAGRVQI